MPRPPLAARGAGAALCLALLFSGLSGCALIGGSATPGATTQEGQDMDLQPLYDAVTAADPRVVDQSGTVSYSGAAKTLSLAVLLSGDEPVSTEELTAILVAARDNTPSEIETISVIAREAADDEKIIDLQPAIAGLPADLNPLWDGAVTLARVDLDKL